MKKVDNSCAKHQMQSEYANIDANNGFPPIAHCPQCALLLRAIELLRVEKERLEDQLQRCREALTSDRSLITEMAEEIIDNRKVIAHQTETMRSLRKDMEQRGLLLRRYEAILQSGRLLRHTTPHQIARVIQGQQQQQPQQQNVVQGSSSGNAGSSSYGEDELLSRLGMYRENI